MINLLPQEEKDRLHREYLLRFGTVVLVSICVLEVFAFMLFLPTYYALYTSTRDLSLNILERKNLTPEEDATIGRDLTKIKAEIALLRPTESVVDSPPSSLIEEIVRAKSYGIAISAFAYVRGESKPSLQLTGVAETQDDLLAFRRNVQANPRVLDFKYANSFITQKADIPFSATINFK
ncbi:MAG: hypothetical protein A3C93_03860 [Candidatus Lloydbacteria bacterium RIFCSPHIGHO2_02_FULL_54_17]|uniref:Uncharacterized protein n=1 Tax=Candidatus Lloydbacteria bacterium RIFCSPHIGHO2_02_FULL_54_17 TaxID=1798664 RepID=A0A1G2DHC8_9BACT|nr:MAG: hypothetical protein A2762_00270 [Candidatus Lloydbacteria bacterium RIFCSPHIGHO2_01_FULL_54_11]OGZ13009.1 MAG: hypothetical protein A3C93_03860 [Candidatus Lloydbacteria bacterium RIFCSPHIGHO2_02_FULL_54_17]OGZ15108.1 MAG: hypothetical protein A3H76_00405 [Candidatus Lloydbacteria bacterium RIFCSPLOWO2_02_FULL_54_12]OGZ15244.1 MAG: hypothetical protein A2948_05540 [Candidatus Lloydbacteria bacterium RIFCSPLOWO2_01_FULL_54_18]